MALNVFADSAPSIDYSKMRALVIDDYPGMRSAFKMTLANFGLSKADMAANASEALGRVRNTHYDFIICDYNLGDGRDGQQLLEEMRYRGVMPLETAFVMVTAENLYEKVVATAELAPDDYLIKPFNSEVLRNRLDIILARKKVFADVYWYFGRKDAEGAIQACDEVIKNHPKYVVDALRFKGELLNALGRFQEAEELYKRVIEMRAIPWARMGLAKALHLQNEEDEAEDLLKDIIDETPEMVSAYDLLADVRMAKKDMAGAQAILKQGTEVSPKTVKRQQKLGDVAARNGDLNTAKTAYKNAIEKGRNSVFVTPTDYANLCRVQVEQGDTGGAMETLNGARKVLRESDDGQLVVATVEGVVYSKMGRSDAAQKSLDEAARLRKGGARGDERMLLDLAEAYSMNGRHDECDAIVADVAKNAHDSEALLAKARKIYEDAGRADAGSSVLSKATEKVRQLNNEGVMLAQKGKLAEAMTCMRQAAREAPYNPRVGMNAAFVLLRYLKEEGMDEEILEEAIALIDAAEQMAPGHARLPGLRHAVIEIENHYGIRRKK